MKYKTKRTTDWKVKRFIWAVVISAAVVMAIIWFVCEHIL